MLRRRLSLLFLTLASSAASAAPLPSLGGLPTAGLPVAAPSLAALPQLGLPPVPNVTGIGGIPLPGTAGLPPLALPGTDALPALPGLPPPALPGTDALPALPGVPGVPPLALPGTDELPALPSVPMQPPGLGEITGTVLGHPLAVTGSTAASNALQTANAVGGPLQDSAIRTLRPALDPALPR